MGEVIADWHDVAGPKRQAASLANLRNFSTIIVSSSIDEKPCHLNFGNSVIPSRSLQKASRLHNPN